MNLFHWHLLMLLCLLMPRCTIPLLTCHLPLAWTHHSLRCLLVLEHSDKNARSYWQLNFIQIYLIKLHFLILFQWIAHFTRHIKIKHFLHLVWNKCPGSWHHLCCNVAIKDKRIACWNTLLKTSHDCDVTWHLWATF